MDGVSVMPAPLAAGELDAFGTMVREAREARGWNQARLGSELGGMTQTQVSDLELGWLHNVDAALVVRLSTCLDLPVEALLQAAVARAEAPAKVRLVASPAAGAA
jgi:transcriptional regulator with XRE-family HTH domain